MPQAIGELSFHLHIPTEFLDQVPESLKDDIEAHDQGWADSQAGCLSIAYAAFWFGDLCDALDTLNIMGIPWTVRSVRKTEDA